MKKRLINGGCIDCAKLGQIIMNVLFVILSIAVIMVVGYTLYRFHRFFLEGPYRVDIDEARKTKYDVYLDVRTHVERDLLGFYPNSVHIPATELQGRVMKEIPDKKKKILVYCNTGHRAKLAAQKMREMGYVNAVYIAESFRELM